jgi:hypothetical protein
MGQQSLPNPATYSPASDAEAARLEKAWLHSGDPRLVAWAAELIANDARRDLIPDLIDRLNLPENDATRSGSALQAIVDALIQLGARVPADRVMKLPSWCITQQVILLARSPDSREPLMKIFEEAADPLVWLAAADLLAVEPKPDFARTLLSDFHVVATFVVMMPGDGYGFGGGCGGSVGCGGDDPGWPAINSYGLSLAKGTLFTSGVHPVRYYTFPLGKPRGQFDCSSVSRDQFIPGLLAQVARIPASELRLESGLNEQITYLGTDSYLANVRAFLLPLNEDFQQLLTSYVRLGFLSSSEADTMQLPVDLTIEDRRAPPSPPLPPLSPILEFAFLAVNIRGD